MSSAASTNVATSGDFSAPRPAVPVSVLADESSRNQKRKPQLKLTVPAHFHDGIWYLDAADADRRADATWSEAARANAIRAAAATEDPNPFAKYPDWIRPHFRGRTGTLLDAGCGYGRVSIPLLEENPGLRCVGIDASPVMLNGFLRLARKHGVADRVELYCGNLADLPFADSTFEFVLSCAVLLHVPKAEAKGIVRELRRVLAIGGTLVLQGSFPNVFNLESIVSLHHNFALRKNGPVRVYTRSEVKSLFADMGHVDVEAHQLIVLPRSLGSVRMPFADAARRLNAFCTQHYLDRFRHSGLFVNHHDVVAVK